MPKTFYYEKNEAFSVLAEGSDSIFESNTRLLVFAASLGFARNRRAQTHDENGEVRWNYIGQNQRLRVITMSLAYAHHEDPSVILDASRQIETLQTYGASGARILQEEVIEEPGDPLDNLITLLQQHRDQDEMEDQVGILEDIENEISSL